MTEYKYYIYTQSGILINRVNFQKQIEDHGIPSPCTSCDGLVFIFQKTYEQIKNQGYPISQIYDRMLKVSIMEITERGF